MSQQTINLGTAPNTQDGDPLRTGGLKINANFTELYSGKQPLNDNLTSLAAIIGQADRLPYFTGVGALSATVLTALGRSILSRVTAADVRTDIGLGTAAVADLGTPSGAASLGADGKLLPSQTPDISINNVYPVSSQAAMLALPANQGDIAIRTDEANKPYILAALPASTLANWFPIGQSLSDSLAALSGLVPAADRLAYYTGANTASLTVFNALGRSLVGAASELAARTALGISSSTPLSVSEGGTGRNSEFRKSYIEGLMLTWNGAQSLTVSEGSAYIPGSSSILQLTNPLTLSGMVTSASTLYHIYLYSNGGTPSIEFSTAVPLSYSGGGYTKTGDNTRRYLGSIVTIAANSIVPFSHHPGTMSYSGNLSTAPFFILNASVITSQPVNCSGVAPLTAYRMKGFFINAASDATAFFGCPPDGSAVSSINYDFYIQTSNASQAEINLNASQQFFWRHANAANATMRVLFQSYYFKR